MYLNISVSSNEEYPPDESPNIASIRIFESDIEKIKKVFKIIKEFGNEANCFRIDEYGMEWLEDFESEMELNSNILKIMSTKSYLDIVLQEDSNKDRVKSVRMEGGVLNVSNDFFWYTAYLKHTNIEYTTELISIKHIKDIERFLTYEKLQKYGSKLSEELSNTNKSSLKMPRM